MGIPLQLSIALIALFFIFGLGIIAIVYFQVIIQEIIQMIKDKINR